MTPADIHEIPSPEQPDRMWLLDGVLYVNINQPVTPDSIIALTDEVTTLLDSQGLQVVPAVVRYTNGGKKFGIKLSDMGKVASMHTISRISAIILVGLEGVPLKLTKLGNKAFFNNRMVICDTIDDAWVAAQKFKTVGLGVLEQDRSD